MGTNSFLATEELKVLRREVEQLRMERDILKKAVAFFAKESAMRYRFIQAEKAYVSGGACCVACSAVARSGYYAWCRRPLGARAQQNHWL